MRKPTICICENKDADQLRGNREADQRLCFRYIDNTIPLLSKSKKFKPLVIFCSCTAWFVSDQVRNKIVGFLMTRLISFAAAMIRGNRANCAQFAQSYRLDWLVHRLESQMSSKGVLEVLHCVLIDSPEALNMIKEKHIVTIISLIDKHGRDPKVKKNISSLSYH